MADGMTQHDYQIGILLDKLDELGITDNTIVIYTTDNGAEKFSWPDGGTSPFKGEKATTWEGGIRVPFMIRWPEKIAAGKVSNEIISLEDCLPTLLAAAGDSDIKSKLLNGHSAAGKTFKVHIDGYNFLPYLTGDAEEGPRNEFFAFVDDGSLGAVRYGRWKFHFSTQDHEGLGAWIYPQTVLKAPLLVDLYADPFELAMDNSAYYDDWVVRRMFAFEPLKNIVGSFMATFKDFPPRQESGSFTPRQ